VDILGILVCGVAGFTKASKIYIGKPEHKGDFKSPGVRFLKAQKLFGQISGTIIPTLYLVLTKTFGSMKLL